MSVLSYYKSSSPHRYVVNYSMNSIRRDDGQRVEEKVDKSNDFVVIDIIDDDSDRSQFGDEEKLCRICYESSKSSQLIELGCDCRGEIGFAHRKCAAIWFSYKGNKICEICGKKAKNASSSSSNKNNVTVTTSTMTTMPAVRATAVDTSDEGIPDNRKLKLCGRYLLKLIEAATTFFVIAVLPDIIHGRN